MTVRLELSGVRRVFTLGGERIAALDGIDLTIEPGEMVAIIGASGSGKSTLMNILGCLDRPSEGHYRIGGEDVQRMGADGLARLRRAHFGFVFQRYHLVATLSALANVELPAVYGGMRRAARRERAAGLMTRLGLGERLLNRPWQLSGGQQQRVAIARALINGGGIVLADEPTGALDSRTGEALLALLKALNAEGRTVVIVTHDAAVAAHAKRIVEIADGRIVGDRLTEPAPEGRGVADPAASSASPPKRSGSISLVATLSMALSAFAQHKLRMALAVLGVAIGVAATVGVIGSGEAARRAVARQMEELGTNTLQVMPGTVDSYSRGETTAPLTLQQAEILGRQAYADSVASMSYGNGTIERRGRRVQGFIQGVSPSYFRVNGHRLIKGRLLDEEDARGGSAATVISVEAAEKLFEPGEDPVGQTVRIGQAQLTVIGVVRQSSLRPDLPTAFLTHESYGARIAKNARIMSIVIRLKDSADSASAVADVTRLLQRLRGRIDFEIMDSAALNKMVGRSRAIFQRLGAALAAVSLVIGGIGVMNIMLVSVTERTREIGLRMALGARRRDIMLQFLMEASLVCLVGGCLGTACLSLALQAARLAGVGLPLVVEWPVLLLALLTALSVGLVFGYLPARNAARLDPSEALARE